MHRYRTIHTYIPLYIVVIVFGLGFQGISIQPAMENQMEKKMEDDVELG